MVKMKWNNLNIYTISSAIDQFAGGLIGPFYVVYIQKIGGSIENLGIAFAILMIFQSLFSYWGGKYSDKLGRKPLLIFVGYLSSVLTFAYTLIQSVTQLYVLQAIFGISGAIYIAVSTAFLGDITQRSRRGHQIGKFKAIIGIFAAISLAIGGFIIGRFGFKIIFYAVALFGIASTTLLFWIKETVRKKK
jgi:DHA1 family multidrug resistance protein-like MFS transporter